MSNTAFFRLTRTCGRYWFLFLWRGGSSTMFDLGRTRVTRNLRVDAWYILQRRRGSRQTTWIIANLRIHIWLIWTVLLSLKSWRRTILILHRRGGKWPIWFLFDRNMPLLFTLCSEMVKNTSITLSLTTISRYSRVTPVGSGIPTCCDTIHRTGFMNLLHYWWRIVPW